MVKKRYSKIFRLVSVERMKRCCNISVLPEELGVHRRLLYTWRDKLDPVECEEAPAPVNSPVTIETFDW